jgi:cation transport ATPase
MSVTATAPSAPRARSLAALMTAERWIEVGRIVLTGLIVLLYWQQLVPIQVLWAAVAIGLYPLGKTGIADLVAERKIGTEIFVTIATLVAVFGGETVAGAVLMVIILIAELNTERARASIKALIGSVPRTAWSAQTEPRERCRAPERWSSSCWLRCSPGRSPSSHADARSRRNGPVQSLFAQIGSRRG